MVPMLGLYGEYFDLPVHECGETDHRHRRPSELARARKLDDHFLRPRS